MLSRPLRPLFLALLAGLSFACRSSGSALVFGGDIPQQDLVESVQDAKEVCAEAKTDFTAAFHLYQRLTSPQAVELEELSGDFEDALESCHKRGKALARSLDSVNEESAALFQGWNEELASFSGDALRKKSESMMQDTETRAKKVSVALERVSSKMEVVLFKLQDYALFFHHNLNARAIATLQDTYKDFDAEFRALESELGKAEGELEAFLAAFVQPKTDGKK